ncbi:MAG: ferrous iron transport protein B [Puniceicoccaceae bacterium]
MHARNAKACESCLVGRESVLRHLNLKLERWDYVVALAGNPNTGKSTVFNALTGLKQHTGNWPGKTITRAEGGFEFDSKKFKLVDLPGTYSLHTQSPDESVARDFILNGQPDVTVVVCDATAMTRNLNLAIQIRQITGRVVIALNLMDEARRSGIEIDCEELSHELQVPVIPMVARRKEGLEALMQAVADCATDGTPPSPLPVEWLNAEARNCFSQTRTALAAHLPDTQTLDWLTLRVLQGFSSELQEYLAPEILDPIAQQVRQDISEHRLQIDDQVTGAIFAKADAISARICRENHSMNYLRMKAWLDTLLIGKWTGIPIMALMFAGVLWLTIVGSNYPSSMLSTLLVEHGYTLLRTGAEQLSLPQWLIGLFVDGMYLTVAWVVSVMLPPMAIFFPLFTLLEDFGYLPRVAFNLDGLFKKSGAHGKQALTMAMGYGCNAAGVIAARIIESPRERLVAILTNNFALCNGRWPTQILIASLFIGALVPAHYAGLVSAFAVAAVAFLGVLLTFLSSWLLSRTLLRGESSAFSLELPPYRPPQILRTLYVSLIDRTLFVLWRAIVFAAPAGIVIWGISNLQIGDQSLALHAIAWLDPIAMVFGLTGVILLAYLIAIPANEIVIPTILMLTVMQTGLSIDGASGAGVMFESEEFHALSALLTAGGWTTLTAVCLMLFSLCHNPCSTTIFTIYKETHSVKWTTVATLMPLAFGFGICALVATLWRGIA